MDERLSKFGRKWLGTLCVVSVCGAVGSCTDDYELDDGTPSWLNSSIYEYLQTGNKYTDFVRLIDDLNMDTVLRKTGSKTLFVADNEAFAEFYKDNIWNVHSYEELTMAQKRLLFNSAMVNNAYLLEMMSSTSGANGPQKGLCLRRETASAVTDSIPYFTADELPVSYNLDDKDYWARFRQNGDKKGGIRMALDGTAPMMLHFLEGYLTNQKITNDDFQALLGVERAANDAYVYDAKVVEADIRCQNGYVNRLDKVLLVPQNLAEVLRTNGRTNLFSHMIERFSAPFYSKTWTDRYNLLNSVQVDSIFEKRYFSFRSQGNTALNSDRGTDPINNPAGTEIKFGLTFDPGWNGYVSDEKGNKENDMGVIFAPVDEVLYSYFFDEYGGGRFLIEAYAPDAFTTVQGPTDYENIYKAIDQIPLHVIQALTNNLMKNSFNNTVPSKFVTVKNDAQDPMFGDRDDVQFADVLLANNGIIYAMNEVLTPARYAAVSAPALVAEDMKIFNFAITRGSNDNKPGTGETVYHFYAYLLAMNSRFSFFVPSDNNFIYIDPASFKTAKSAGSNMLEARAFKYEWDEKKGQPKCTSYKYHYDVATGQGTIVEGGAVDISLSVWMNRLNDMLETHTVVHEAPTSAGDIDETVVGIERDKNFFISKNGAPLYIKTAYDGGESRRKGMQVMGGWQLQHPDDVASTVTRFDDKTREKNGNGNGMTYQIDAPMIPTIESVYSALYKNANFSDFFALCQTDDEVMKMLSEELKNDNNYIGHFNNLKRFNIFVEDGGIPCFKNDGSKVDAPTNVRFFNNYRYTVYVPTNTAIRAAHDRGLPTWQQIRDLLQLDVPEEERVEYDDATYKAIAVKAYAMATTIINFVKYHFQDNSVFVDTPALAETEYSTATLNSEKGVYCKVKVSSAGGETLAVKGIGNSVAVGVTNDRNIMVRDYIISGTGNNQLIKASSFAVMHGINGVLDYMEYAGGRYDASWATPAAAKEYISNYRIIE